MSVTNADRHGLHKALEGILGEHEANVLMEHLPPVGWADVATKRDLDHLEQRVEHQFAEVRHEISDLHKDTALQISELRSAVAAQRLRHTIALVGILGALMALFNTLG